MRYGLNRYYFAVIAVLSVFSLLSMMVSDTRAGANTALLVRVRWLKTRFWTFFPPRVPEFTDDVEIHFFGDATVETETTSADEFTPWKKVSLFKYHSSDATMLNTVRSQLVSYLKNAVWFQGFKKTEITGMLENTSRLRLYFDIPHENNVIILIPYSAVSQLSGKEWQYAVIRLLCVPDDVVEPLKKMLDSYYLSSSFTLTKEGEYESGEHEELAEKILSIAGTH